MNPTYPDSAPEVETLGAWFKCEREKRNCTTEEVAMAMKVFMDMLAGITTELHYIEAVEQLATLEGESMIKDIDCFEWLITVYGVEVPWDTFADARERFEREVPGFSRWRGRGSPYVPKDLPSGITPLWKV